VTAPFTQRVGSRGWAFRLPPVNAARNNALPETAAVLAEWVVHLQTAPTPRENDLSIGPTGLDLLVSCAHLRQVPGQVLTPHRVRLSSSHEFMILALDHRYAPWDFQKANLVLRDGHRITEPDHVAPYVHPPLVGLHLDNYQDMVARNLVPLAVNALLDGVLGLADPPVRQHNRWHAALESAARAMQAGKRCHQLEVPAAVEG
jgi:hypothetical protein